MTQTDEQRTSNSRHLLAAREAFNRYTDYVIACERLATPALDFAAWIQKWHEVQS